MSSYLHHAVYGVEFLVSLFERLAYAHNALYAGAHRKCVGIEYTRVAYDAEYGTVYALVALHVHSVFCQLSLYIVYVLCESVLFHYDNHFNILL